jgi:hypothetical protein
MGGNFLRVARQVWNPAADGTQPHTTATAQP